MWTGVPLLTCLASSRASQLVRRIQPCEARLLIVNASAYTCRQRVGSSKDRLSEHSFANALDVSAFVMKDGRTIDVLTHWGATGRDRHAQPSLGAGAIGGGLAQPLSDVGQEEAALTTREYVLTPDAEASLWHLSTVLGPEANEAHRNHLHLDLAPRRRNPFCE